MSSEPATGRHPGSAAQSRRQTLGDDDQILADLLNSDLVINERTYVLNAVRARTPFFFGGSGNGRMVHMGQTHEGQPSMQESVAQLRQLDRASCVIWHHPVSAHCRADTGTRDIPWVIFSKIGDSQATGMPLQASPLSLPPLSSPFPLPPPSLPSSPPPKARLLGSTWQTRNDGQNWIRTLGSLFRCKSEKEKTKENQNNSISYRKSEKQNRKNTKTLL